MTKWEYVQVPIKLNEMYAALNELGDEGWELCESISLAPAKLGKRMMFMKRRKQQ